MESPSNPAPYTVGGIRLPRPFKVRRLGHFGVNVADPEISRGFYERLESFGGEARGSTPAEMRERVIAEVARWKKVIAESKIPQQ